MKNTMGSLLFLGIMYVTNLSYAHCEKDWIKSNSSDGSIIVLSMGSVWEVDQMDRIDTILWLPVDNVLACDDGFLINEGSGKKVSARQVR